MTNIERIVDTITGRAWGRFKQFMALVALGLMIGQAA